jgi:endonuclease-3
MQEGPNQIKINIDPIIQTLRQSVATMELPIVTEISQNRRSPFEVLIATILSLRTKDEVTRFASKRLLERAHTPHQMLSLDDSEIAKLIYPVGFYKTKSKTILEISRVLIRDHDGLVPDNLDDLLCLKGVGRKTANLVITLGYGKLGVCVDTHVHRISNRLGYVKTKTPEQTEMALRAQLPKQYWIQYNDLLVTWGQNVCKPISPICSKCDISQYCQKVGVTRSR